MADQDPIMGGIMEAITQLHGGDRAGARTRFAALWEAIGPDGDPFHRCTLCHYMADAQDDPREELVWDLLALAAADALTEERVTDYHGALDLQGFYPSLHLNVAESYRKTGDLAMALRHVTLAQAAVEVLPDDGYGGMIRMGIDRLAERLTAGAD